MLDKNGWTLDFEYDWVIKKQLVQAKALQDEELKLKGGDDH